MEKNHKKIINQKILHEIEETKKSVTELKVLTLPIAPDCAIGRVSRMDAINNKSINVGLCTCRVLYVFMISLTDYIDV